ncbi:hypothetical protein, partial [Staphylococcus aureus]|uniref:hypothetical protein n=1 Tax=Staphylococcus aureus TaxID=1280 RepID=UPI0039BE1F62
GVSALSLMLQPGGELTKQFTQPTGSEVEQTPGFQFQMDEGSKAIQRAAAASGGLRGGGTLKALEQYSHGLASTYYNDAFNRALTTFQTNRNNT